MAWVNFSVTSGALISGCKSYVATAGELTKIRCSPSNSASRPPLKKKVTCAYFSVSAMRSWVLPCDCKYSPNVLVSDVGSKAILVTSLFCNSSEYLVSITNFDSVGSFSRVKPSKSAETSAWLISRARSARKFIKITLSLSWIVPKSAFWLA